MEEPESDDTEIMERVAEVVVDTMNAESIERVKRELPNIKEHTQKIQRARGAGIESAVMSEQIFNHILSYMGHSWNEINNLTYGQKIKELINIMETYLKNVPWVEETIINIKKMKGLRNIYAHVPGDYGSGILRFSQEEKYYKKEDIEFIGKDLDELNKIFADLVEKVQARVMDIFKKLLPIREKQKLSSK